MNPALKRVFIGSLALWLVALRFYRLGVDPPSWLSWSTGIYTDEGVYSLDARSSVLFGHWSIGNFHSAEIAPLHHLLLLAVFHLLGVSLVDARLIGVISSLFALTFFYLALKKQFNQDTALLGIIFLGLSPLFIFYNRLALLETPTVLLLTIALYLSTIKKQQWATGIFLALAVIYKPLAILCIPAFFSDIVQDRKLAIQRASAVVMGLLFYFIAWQLPHQHDLSRLNKYYLLHQYLPHTVAGLIRNLARALWTGRADGVLPYMLKWSPILAVISAVPLIVGKYRNNGKLLLYYLWLGLPIATLCCLSYTPSRYFVLFLPALAAISAVVTVQLKPSWRLIGIGAFVALSTVVTVGSLLKSTNKIAAAGLKLNDSVALSTTIIGQYSAELALQNHQPCLYVQPGLANSYGKVPSGMVLVTLSPYWDNYWDNRLRGNRTPQTNIELRLPHGQNIVGVRVAR